MEFFLEIDVVKEIEISKQTRTFTLNEDNRITKLLIGFYEDLVQPRDVAKTR